MALQVARLVAVVALLCAAAAIATPKGRLPLALRGLAKLLKNDQFPESHPSSLVPHPSFVKRFLAFFLVILAVTLALI